jgi:DNA-binding SARP family transcriptional activator/Tfp pilus assembly protein PilF
LLTTFLGFGVKHKPGRRIRPLAEAALMPGPGSCESAWAPGVPFWLHLRATRVRFEGEALIRRGDSRDSEAWMSGVRFTLLGRLMLAGGAGDPVALSGARQRALLASLLLSANVPVSPDALAEAVWDGSPPPGAPATLRSHIKRLRRALGPQAGARITACDPGYLISVQEPELDVLLFETACRNAGTARRATRWQEASAAATRALELWRGTPLLDVPSQVLRDQFVPRLEQMRLQALEDRAEADLRLGRQDRLIPELRELAGRHPLRERFHAQLMEALARGGRQAEALDAYRRARRALVDELGIEPGPHLRLLHQQILDGDPALAAPPAGHDGTPQAPAPAADSASSPAGVPRELPGTAAHFTGREDELAVLAGLLDRGGEGTPGTVVISAIGGTAGVGKTALAVHWAHQVADRFPDGQLYVNLRGYDPGQLVPAADALARFLRTLGVPGQDIPADEDERAARYRSRLAGKHMLIVLDNARSAGQVRPLLPGTPSCAVVVTSRDALAGLVARDGAARLDLDLLAPQDAVGLLRALIGARVDADPGAAALLAQQCSRLPLALRVAAELVVARGGVPLARLADELADQQQRLNLLDAGGDPDTAIRAVFSWSCRHLDTVSAQAFRLAGLHPGPDFGPHAVAALTGATLQDSRGVLDLLARAHLIQQPRSGRYGMHDLLRAYARELAAAHDDQDGQHAALTRLFDYYLHSAAAAMDTLHPAERHRRPRIPPASTPAPPVTGPAAARAWLDAERANLVAITAHAAGHGWPEHATWLAATMFRYLDAGSYTQEAIIIYTHARAAARQTGDHAAEANTLMNVAGVYWQQSRYQQAADHLQQALALSRQIGDRGCEAATLTSLGVLCIAQGRYQEAHTTIAQALDIYRQAGDLSGEMNCLINLGNAEERLGRYQQAARHHYQSLSFARKADDRYVECTALINLGTVRMRQGDLRQADGYLGQALALCRETSNRYQQAQAEALTRTGDVRLRRGRPQEACDRLQEALALYQEIGDRSGQADALNSLGEAHLAAGQPGRARTHHAAACEIATDIGDTYQQARAHDGLARAHHALASPGQARDHWAKALALYTRLGTPEADQVRTQLAEAYGRP